MKKKYKLAILVTHVIQYQCPFYRELAKYPEIDLKVFFCNDLGYKKYFDSGFGKEIQWDNDLLSGFSYEFLKNVSPFPNPSTFFGSINLDIVLKLKNGCYDAVIISGWNTFTNHLALISGINVLMRADSNVKNPVSPWKVLIKKCILEIYFKFIDSFLFVGKNNYLFYKHYGVDDKKLFFVPFAVDNHFFISKGRQLLLNKKNIKRKYGIPENSKVILFSGKLMKIKRPFDLLIAFQDLYKDLNISLVYLGDGILANNLKKYAFENNLNNVFFLGFVNQSQIPEIYSISDLLVLPSSYEAWGLVLNEAMCFGLPLVCSDKVGAAEDLVINGVNGYTYKCGDIQDLKKMILLALKDDKNMGNKSFEIVQKYSYQEAIKGILSYLRSIKNEFV